MVRSICVGMLHGRAMFLAIGTNVFVYGTAVLHATTRLVSASEANIPPTEILALQDFYNSTGGSEWIWQAKLGVPWNFTALDANPCADHWQGVNCTYNTGLAINQITELTLDSTNLVGCLPETLNELSALQTLQLPNNHLRCPLPDVLGLLPELVFLDLSSNSFSSTIPAVLTSLAKLEYLDLGSNFLSYTIPENIGEMESLGSLHLQYNLLSGSLPSSMGNLWNLSILVLQENRLSQELPVSIGNLHNLVSFELRDNRFSGSIPESLSALSKLQRFDLASNFISGTIPLFLGTFTDLAGIGLFVNLLTGTIPNNFQNLTQLLYFECSHNHMTGTIPAYFGTLPKLGYLFMYENMFSGTIPDSFSQLHPLTDLMIYSNQLTGSIPRAFNQLTKLRVLILSNNKLTGTLDVFDPTVQPHLETVIVNNNQFTGTLPAALFTSQSLTVFAAVSNCFHGALPASVCSNDNLVTLVLDGLSSATSCRDTLFPTLSTTYVNSYTVSGTVPACLFHLPNLSTLHLSGNGFTGKLPSDLTVGSSMYDLTLSHNTLSGHIPDSIQQRKWYKLDLSYNRLDGALRSDFGETDFNFSIYRFVEKFGAESEEQFLASVTNDPYYIANVTYYLETHIIPHITLENNRLSGHIPRAVQALQYVSVLGTNLFTCRLDRSDLPQHDSEARTYQCGSTAFDIPYYVWLGLCAVSLLLIVCVVYRRHYFEQYQRLAYVLRCVQEWSNLKGLSLIEHPVLYQLTQLMVWFYKFTCICIGYILFVLSPLYVVLSHYFGIMRYEYAWSISGAFVSGTAPGVTEFVAWSMLMALVIYIGRLLSSSWTSVVQVTSNEDSQLFSYRNCALYVTYIAVNVIVVVGVNSLYVYIAIYQSSSILILAQILLSFFKLGWNNVCASRLLHYAILLWTDPTDTTVSPSRKEVAGGYFSLQVLVALLNNIVVPCAVVLVISPNCFYNVFVPAPLVTATYVYEQCVSIDEDDSCSEYMPDGDSTSYNPPFTYSYQCSSSLVTYYAPAFLIMCLVSTFLVPAMQCAIVWMYHGKSTVDCSNSHILRLVKYMSPTILQPPRVASVSAASFDAPAQPGVFNLSVVLTNLLTFVGLLLTFGAVFPPLAVALAVTIWVCAYFTKLKVGRYVCRAMELDLPQLVTALERDCQGVGSVQALVYNAVWMIVTISCMFYTLFLFDTLGDAVGFREAVWVLVVMPLMPVVLWCVFKGVDRARGPSATDNSIGKDIDTDREMEMTDSSIKSMSVSNPIINR